VCPSIAILYNQPSLSRYTALGESAAVTGVMDEVNAVNNALMDLGCQTTLIPLSPPLETQVTLIQKINVDLIFNLFEGFDGRPETEADVAELLQTCGFRFTGCSAPAMSLALDKVKAKKLLKEEGIATPEFYVVTPENLDSAYFRYPCIVKPTAEDASHGIYEDSVAYNRDSLERLVTRVCRLYGGAALAEEYIVGRELNALVMGDKKPFVLPVSEIVYSLPQGMPRILTFSAKWNPENPYYRCSKAVCPADLDFTTRKSIEKIALRVFNKFGCSGYARVDFRLDHKDNPFVIDVNPNPDISPVSGAVRQAIAGGMDYTEFIERIVMYALGVTMA